MGKIRRKTYLKKVGVIIISVMFFIGVGVGTAVCDNKDKIPNYTQMMSQDTTDTNGRAARLDIEKESDQLNPVERAIIKRDTLITNRAKSKTNN